MLLRLFDTSVSHEQELKYSSRMDRLLHSFGMMLTIVCLLVAFSEMKLTEFQSGDIFVAQVSNSHFGCLSNHIWSY